LSALREMLSSFDEVIVAIGSSQFSHTFENPFTAGERIEMIRMALREDGQDLSRVITVTIPDIGEHRLWVARLVSMCPRFEVAYTNNTFVKLLLEEQGISTRGARLFERESYNATKIRTLMVEGGEWWKYVPSSVAGFIDEIGGVERVRVSRSSSTSALLR